MPENLDRFYGNLRNYVRMVANDYSNLLMLDAKGGLGKSHNVRETLSDELESDESWVHQKGFTTPLELYKTLYRGRHEHKVLFLDDMSGVTNNTKAIDMLKAATDTQGDENVVEYRTSRDIDHPFVDGETLPNKFTFRGSVILSFNDTPDNRHFDALKDRSTYYNMSFTYQERLDLIDAIADQPDISDLSIEEQNDVADWVRTVTNSSFDVTIRTFEEVCKMRKFGNDTDANWERMALEIFNIDHEKHMIIKMRKEMDIPIDEQVKRFTEKFDKSQGYYYDKLDEIRDDRSL